ncbi:MAG: 50S ribosome-binding GTPase [Candidatus Lokiarchaeota archaeon]
MRNPFKSFNHVPDSQELLDIAFKRAMKSSAKVSKNAPILIKAKKKESRRIKVAIEELIERILKIIKMVPIIDELPEFYKELASLLVDTDKLKQNLGKLNGILPVISKIERDYLKMIKGIENPKEGDRLRREVFGRVSSIVNKQNETLLYLNGIRGKLKSIPSLDYTKPTIVCAGAPNVGKSSLVKVLSTNKKINVQEYPFTTKTLNFGHLKIKRQFDTLILQIIDTPGILDRPMSERNEIELQAILALRLISDMILFIFDPTPSSGYTVESQIQLFNEIKTTFCKSRDIKMFPIFNKMDLASESEISYLKKHKNCINTF